MMELKIDRYLKLILSVVLIFCSGKTLSFDITNNTTLVLEKDSADNATLSLKDLIVLPIVTENIITSTKFQNESRFVKVTKYINLDLNTLEYTTVVSENYPDPYSPGEFEWIVSDGGGYGVEIIIRTLDLNGNTDDYLLIKPGGLDDPEENAIIFTWKLKSERKFKLLHKDNFYIKFSAKSEEMAHKGFKIDMRRIGEIITTTEPTTTTPGPIIFDPYENSTIYLKGKNYNDFTNETKLSLSKMMAEIAEQFCAEKNITVDPEINIVDNVKFHEIGRCNLNWVDSEICTYLVYSIAVNNISTEYELTTKNLDEMWEKYNKDIDLASLGLEIYSPRNDFMVVLVWILIFVCITIAFGIILCVIWRSNWFIENPRTSFFYDDSEIKKRDDLYPIPHQPVPPLIGLESYPDEFWNKDIESEYLEKETNYMRGNDNLGYDIMESDEMFIVEDISETTLRRSIDTIEADESHS